MVKKCLGCGVLIQYDNPDGLGYAVSEDMDFCQRCFRLKNYGHYEVVNLSNEDYLKVLDCIPSEALVLYVTDVLSLDCYFIERFKNVVLVITKKDVLPVSVKASKIISYVKKNYPFVMDVFFVSGKTGDGMSELERGICKYSSLDEVYLVGTTNSGKSTLVNQFISLFGGDKGLVTTSMYPSTTLDKVEIKLKNFVMVDTPGLIHSNHIVHYLSGSDIKKIMPKGEIKPKSCQIVGRGSIVIGNFVRIDYYSLVKNSITFYVANGLDIHFVSLKNDIMHDFSKKDFHLNECKDIVVFGLGFFKCVHEMDVYIYTLDGVGVCVRDNLI